MASYIVKKTQSITTDEIIKAHAAHGNDFFVVDVNSIRESQYSQYINPYYKLENGDIVNPSTWNYQAPEGIQVSSNIRAPNSRPFEQIRVGFSQVDENKEVNINMKALELICNAYEYVMEKMIDDKLITDNKKKEVKGPDGKFKPKYIMSCKIDSPMQTTFKNRETGLHEASEHPFYWINLQKKRYWGAEKAPPVKQFEDMYYLNNDGSPDLSKPVNIYEFNTTFYNIENFFFDKKTGKQHFKLLGDYKPEVKQTVLNNCNIQDYLTNGSILMGSLSIQIAISRTKCKLDVSVGRKTYVKMQTRDYDNDDDTANIAAFAQRFSIKTKSDEDETKQNTEDAEEKDEEEFEEEEEDDF